MSTRFIGQQAIRDYLRIEINHAKQTGNDMPHVLLTGPAGMGKSTMGKIIAAELGYELKSYVADSTWNAAKVYRELMKLDTTGYGPGGIIASPQAKRYVVFMDEVHLLPSFEPWFCPLQDCEMYWNGAVNWLPVITFIGATTVPNLPKPFMDRIALKFRFSPYTNQELVELIQQSYRIPDNDAYTIAQRSRETARIALHYANAYVKHGGLQFFDKLGIDERGLTPLDRAYLDALRKTNRPLSLNTLAAMTGEDRRSLESVVEPWLKALSLVLVTPQGRMLAEADTVNREGRGKSERNQVLDNLMEGAFSSL